MTQEQFQKLFDKQNDAGANFSLLAQLKFLFEFSAPDEMYELIVQSEEFEIREWMRFSLMDGIPMEQIREYPQMNVAQIRESRRQYFYKREGVQELKETEEIMNRKLQKLEFLIEKSEPMEKFLNVLLKQKDDLIENFQQQITRMQEQNSYLTEQVKEYSERIEEIKMKEQQAEKPAEIAEYQEIREENPVVLPTVRRSLWRKKYWKKMRMRLQSI